MNFLAKHLTGILCLIASLFYCLPASFAAVRTAVAVGNWTSNATWDCNCQPQAGDVIVIPTGYTVHIPNSTVVNLSSGASTTINITGGVIQFGNNSSKLILGDGSSVNVSAGELNPANCGNTTVFMQFGASCTNPALACAFSGKELCDWQASGSTSGTQFSQSGSSSLPVELASFKASVFAGETTLRWLTKSEQNNSGFHIERSADGLNFSQLAWVDGHGTSLEERSYFFIDQKPLPGLNYYRLVQVDFDGKQSASPLQVVRLESAQQGFSLRRDLAAKQLSILLPEAAAGQSKAEIFDLSGRLLAQKTMEEGALELEFELNGLPSGMYVARLAGAARMFSL